MPNLVWRELNFLFSPKALKNSSQRIILMKVAGAHFKQTIRTVVSI